MNVRKLFLCLAVIMIFDKLMASSALTADKYYFTSPKTNLIQGRIMGPNADYKLIRYEDIAWLKEAYAERNALSLYGPYDKNTNAISVLIRHKTNSFDRISSRYIDPASVSDISNFVVQGSVDIFQAGARPIDVDTLDPSRKKLISLGWLTNAFAKIKKAHTVVFNHDKKLESHIVEYPYSSSSPHYVYTNDSIVVYPNQTDSGTVSSYSQNEIDVYKHVRKGSGSIAYVPARGTLSSEDWKVVRGPDTSYSYDMQAWQALFSVKMYQYCDIDAWMRGRQTPGFYKSAKVFGIVSINEEMDKWENGSNTNYIKSANVFLKLADSITFVESDQFKLTWSFQIDTYGLASAACALAGMNGPTWASGATASVPPVPENPYVGYRVVDFHDLFSWDTYDDETEIYNEDERSFSMHIWDLYVVFDLSPATEISSE